ncbi:nodulation protein NodH [bacterium]|nr:nodulation protein NodH [bacterium]
MRTGSNFLEANLNAIPGVTCYGEAFNPVFVGNSNKTELLGVSIHQRDLNPESLLKVMRKETEGLSGFRYFHNHDPRVFDMVVDDPTVAKIILTRNPLESYISWKIAKESNQWRTTSAANIKTARPRFLIEEFRERVDTLQEFQRLLLNRLQVSGQTAFYIDYEDVLDLKVINGLAAFLGVEGRLEKLDLSYKKQNPEPLTEKVSNPAEMAAGLNQIDFYNLRHTPNFEPRRQGAINTYVASAAAPLLFQPIKAAPDQAMRKWLQTYGEVLTGFDRQGLKAWRSDRPGHRSFTVLRHPLARAHAAFCDFLDKEWMAELRGHMKRIHKFELPPKGEGFADQAAHRAGFLKFLEVVKHLHAGRTELRTPPHLATQIATIGGFAQLQAPDHILREDRLEEGLAFLCAEVGVKMQPLPKVAEPGRFALDQLYDRDLEAAAREAYGRDYIYFGFEDWR